MDKDFKNIVVDPAAMAAAAKFFAKNSILSSSTTASFTKDIESGHFLEAYKQMEDRFVPQIDFSTASNFAKFGSATKYYEDAYIRIYNQYPYDGSQKEKVLWDLSSTYIDKYIFENVYPRTNGYITMGAVQTPSAGTHTTPGRVYNSTDKEYIFFKGGPNADPREDYKSEIVPGQSIKGLSKANVYNTASFRESNLKIDLYYGNTVEFWLKKNQWVDYHSDLTGSAHGTTEYIFDLWNSASVDSSGSGGNYGRFSIYINSAAKGTMYALVQSGSAAAKYWPPSLGGEGGFDTGLTDIADGSWHHYALTTQNSGTFNKTKFYVDGKLTSQNSASSAEISAVSGAYVATIGSQVRRAGLDSNGGLGWGKISGSIDEFRFWKTARNAKEIGRFYIDQINGGTNTDAANTKLGVYYKFNEGITQTSSADATVLDYSGRISNGAWTGYDSNTGRSTGSAIVISGKATKEFRDPIVYPLHPLVKSTLADLKIKGDMHDYTNSTSLINSLPSWIVEDDLTDGPGELHKLIQILSSYLDTLYLQIEALPTIKNIDYASSSAKPHFFNNRLLVDYGFDVDEILTDIDLFAYANTRDDDRLFEQKLYNIKNQIYKNIYNNLIHIYKTKGTEKSFNNLMRAIGIDQELVRLNMYGLGINWRAQTNTRMISSKSKCIDYYNNNSATVYGWSGSAPASNSYISGSNDVSSGIDKYAPITVESEIIFPKYLPLDSPHYKEYAYHTSSLFGMHSARSAATSPAASSATDMTWASGDSGSFQVFAIRKQLQVLDEDPEVYFMLTGSAFGAVTSSVFKNVYDNSKWNFAVRLKHKDYPQADFVSGSTEVVQATAELYGVQTIMDSIQNEFVITASFSSTAGNRLFAAPKRVYCGSHYTNFTGALLQRSDVFVSHLRFWETYLNNDVMRAHSKFDSSYGTDFPYRNTYLFEGKKTTGLAKSEMPRMSSLVLNWDFVQVTASDASGRFAVSDFSSGSNSLADYKLSNIVQRQHLARGDFFTADSSDVVERKYFPSSKLVPFDQINSSDMVNIVDFEEEIFTRESRPIEYFFSFEKSMYANISDEILNLFATIKDFHNLIGNPVNRYRKSYKEMEKIREVFFRRIGNTPDLDKFIRYYKWIDGSISDMLMNLAPATANFPNRVYTVIESHVLERNKIETKYPVLELNQPEPDSHIKAINELLYNWKHGHFPNSGLQADNCLYWKDRAERTGSVITSGDSAVDSQRQTIKRFANSVVSGSTYVLRKLTRPYRFAVDRSEDFKIDNIKLNFAKTELDRSNRTENIVLQNIEPYKDCNDDKALISKRKVDFQANVNGRFLKGRTVAPFTIFSSSVSTGYKSQLSTFGDEVAINDNHRDVYGAETQEPIQGPFSKIHVGGKKSRKVAPFTTTDRIEEYDLTVNSSNLTLSQRAHADAKSKYFLDEIAKRPVVIKNIKTSTSSLYLGNYTKEYQMVQTVGANTQKGWLKDNFANFTQTTPEVLNLTGNLNFNMYARTGSSLQSVTIADRFSGPGSPEAMSPGYLDPASNTFSVYNSINYRNITVRLPRTNIQRTGSSGVQPASQYQFRPFGGNPNQSLRTLRTTVPLNSLWRNFMAPGQGAGLDGRLTPQGSFDVTASIHKVNRNIIHRASSYIWSGVQIAINDYLFDNGFVQHAIPQSDRQYAWITASLSRSFAGPWINVNAYAGGYGGRLTAPLGYSTKKNDITFVSASDFGTFYSGFLGGRIFGTTTKFAAGAGATLLRTDFVGLNSNIYEPLTASTNLLGYPPGETGYKNAATSWRYKGTSPQGAVLTGLGAGDALLNGIILNRQGPYGWPSWKQIRGGNHPIMRDHRSTNTYSTIDREFPIASLYGTNKYIRGNTIANFTESVVTSKFRPIYMSVVANNYLQGLEPEGAEGIPPLTSQKDFKFTYGNSMGYFANEEIFPKITLTSGDYASMYDARRTPPEVYNSITKLYLPNKLKILSPVKGFNYLKMKEVVWPREKNTFLNRTRARNNYSESSGLGSNGYDRISHRTFWRDNLSDRLARTNGQALNSQGSIISIGPRYPRGCGTVRSEGAAGWLSVWPLDGRYTGSINTLTALGNQCTSGKGYSTINPGLGATHLELAASGNCGALYNGGLYRSNRFASVLWYNLNRFVTASCRYHGVDWNMGAFSGTHDTTWNGSSFPVFYPQLIQFTASSNIHWTTNIDSGRNPWYDSYEDYCADLSKIGKDYSIVPEFNISDYVPYYVSRSDWVASLPSDRLMIQGIQNSASVNKQFYDEYSHSDFLQNFDIVINDHSKLADIKKIDMVCYGLKKLLPYNGFYPVLRTLQMATLLSQSYGSKISGAGSTADEDGGVSSFPSLQEVQAMSAFVQPFFAPGIMYNTIKSGIAVDWPLFTGTPPKTTTGVAAAIVWKRNLSSSANFRLPFEALYDVQNMPIGSATSHAGEVPIYAVTNDPNVGAHFKWSGEKNNDLYIRAMNNFLAETVNLFIHKGELTSFTSRPMKEVNFSEGVTYAMSIDLEKSADFLMTEGASADSVVASDLFKGKLAASRSYGFQGTSHRGVIYGPPTRFFKVTASGAGGLYGVLAYDGWGYCEANDPAYAPYTPPYFYGKSTVNLSYKNTVDDTPTPSLATILNNITASYSNDLSNIPTGSHYTSSTSGAPWRTMISSSQPAIQSMMQISSSLNLFGRKNEMLQQVGPDGQLINMSDPEDPSSYERWVISTKFECPVLNFNHYTDDTKARGMWNGYGNIPNYSSEGISITLRETDPSVLFGAAHNITTGSLLEQLFKQGGSSNRKPVGQLPNDYEKSISECIVAIPFFAGGGGPDNNAIAQDFNCVYSEDDDKHFFRAAHSPQHAGDPGAEKPSLKNLREKMKKFVFPPKYDFENSETLLPPFVMYTFEFTHRFTRQELANIWQGVMPDISMKVVPETSTLSIPVEPGELMSEFWSKISDWNTSRTLVTDSLKQLRWMIFKVKQRAKNVYSNITADITDSPNPYEKTPDHDYSYNWPYDYCSLVELAKIEAGLLLDIPELPYSDSTPGSDGGNGNGGNGGGNGGGGGHGNGNGDPAGQVGSQTYTPPAGIGG